MDNSIEPKKKGKGGLIAVIIIVVLLLVGGGVFAYFKFFRTTPLTYYQNLITKGVEDLFSNIRDDKVYQMDATMDFDIKINGQGMPVDALDLINKLFIKASLQVDRTNGKLVTKFDSTYDNENFFQGDLFVDLKNQKAYVHSTDLIDKYIELGEMSFENYSEMLNVSDEYDFKALEKALKRELPKLIKKEDCSKEDGYYVLKISNNDLLKRTAEMFKSLQKDKDFLKGIGKAAADEFVKLELNPEDIMLSDSQIITIKSNEKSFKISDGQVVISGDINGETTTFRVTAYAMTLMSGSVTVKGNPNDQSISLTLDVPETGQIKLDMTSKYQKISKVDEIDSSKVKKEEDLTEEEQAEMQQNLSKTKLYSIIEQYVNESIQNSNNTAFMSSAYIVLDSAELYYAYDHDTLKNGEKYCLPLSLMESKALIDFHGKSLVGSVLIDLTNSKTLPTYKVYLTDGTKYINGLEASEIATANLNNNGYSDAQFDKCNGQGTLLK